MFLLLLEQTQGLLAHDKVSMGIVAVVILQNARGSSYGRISTPEEGIFTPVPSFPRLFWPCAAGRHHQEPYEANQIISEVDHMEAITVI